MSGMAVRIATLKRSWKKEGLMLIMQRFKSHHWFGYFFDKSMVLFDNIIQIFNLADVDQSGKSSQN
jgi:hypothetical protein